MKDLMNGLQKLNLITKTNKNDSIINRKGSR